MSVTVVFVPEERANLGRIIEEADVMRVDTRPT